MIIPEGVAPWNTKVRRILIWNLRKSRVSEPLEENRHVRTKVFTTEEWERQEERNTEHGRTNFSNNPALKIERRKSEKIVRNQSSDARDKQGKNRRFSNRSGLRLSCST
jgi:hypothetical protein